jgi:hypothetical protein
MSHTMDDLIGWLNVSLTHLVCCDLVIPPLLFIDVLTETKRTLMH